MADITVGVDLGGTKIQTVVLRDKQVVGSERVLTPASSADDVIAAIVSAATSAMTAAGAATSCESRRTSVHRPVRS